MPLSQAFYDRIVNEYFPRYPTKRAALMPALWLAQQEQRWLSSETFEEIGDLLEMHPTDVGAVASFYAMFNRRPVGKTVIEICESPSCAINGGGEVMHGLCERLGLHDIGGHGATTVDGEYTIRPIECIAACDYAPAVLVNNRYYGPVTPDKVEEFLSSMDGFSLEHPDSTPRFGTHTGQPLEPLEPVEPVEPQEGQR